MATDINRPYCWSTTRIAESFGFDRGTVRRKLRAAGVAPVTHENGSPLYKLADAVPALYRTEAVISDPDEMTPQDRRAWYQSEVERHAVGERMAHLVRREDLKREKQKLVAAVVAGLDRLPGEIDDVLTRDARRFVDGRIQALRDQMYAESGE